MKLSEYEMGEKHNPSSFVLSPWCSAANIHILVHSPMVLPVVHAVQKDQVPM